MWNWLCIPVCDALTALAIALINAKKPGYPCWMLNKSTWFQGKCMLFHSCFGNCRRLAYKILAYEVCIMCPKHIAACKIHLKSPSRRPDGLTTLDWFTVHEANLSAYIRELAYVRSHVGCGRVPQTLLLHVPQIFHICKSDANEQNFEIKLNLTYETRSIPKIIGILTKVFCTFGSNLVILAWTGDELSHGQAQNGVNFDFEVKFYLEGQGQSPPKTTGILTKVFYTYGPNLVILAWTGDELSRGHASAYRTHRRTDGHTDRQTQATTIPEGQNWPRVINHTRSKIAHVLLMLTFNRNMDDKVHKSLNDLVSALVGCLWCCLFKFIDLKLVWGDSFLKSFVTSPTVNNLSRLVIWDKNEWYYLSVFCVMWWYRPGATAGNICG